jgi:hypothetical protein
MGLGNQPPIKVEAVWTSEESGCGLVIADLGVEGLTVRFRDIGRVADDSVEAVAAPGMGFVLAQGGEQIGLNEMNAIRHAVLAGVRDSNSQSFSREIESGNLGVRKVDGQGNRDGSGAGADVRDLHWLVRREKLQDGFDQMFCFGARNQNGGADLEHEAVELLPPGDVLDGFVSHAAVDIGLKEGVMLSCEFTVGVGEQRDTGDLQSMLKKELGVTCGCRTEMLIIGELCCSGSESLAKGHDGGKRLAVLKQEDISVGVNNGQGLPILGCGDAFFVEMAGGLAKVLRVQGDARRRTQAVVHNLDLLA